MHNYYFLLLFSIKAPKGLKVNARVFPLIYLESDIASAIFLSGTECLRTKPREAFLSNLIFPRNIQAKASNSLGLESSGVHTRYSNLQPLEQTQKLNTITKLDIFGNYRQARPM